MDILAVLYLALITVGISAQSVIKKGYNNKVTGRGVFVFSAISVLSACLFFVFRSGFKFSFDVKALPYAIGFAVAYCVAAIFNFFAIQCGPLSLTSLAVSYSLLIPTLYGIIFDGDKTGVFFYIGLALLAVSLVLINAKKSEAKITLKWVIFTLLALFGNGICSTVQTVQQKEFDGLYQNEFMIIALLIVSAVLFGFALVRERKDFIPVIKVGIIPMVLCGVTNGAVNMLVMITSAMVNKSLMFPIISAGGIVLTWIISMFFYKEKLTLKQNIGVLLGVGAIVFLNL